MTGWVSFLHILYTHRGHTASVFFVENAFFHYLKKACGFPPFFGDICPKKEKDPHENESFRTVLCCADQPQEPEQPEQPEQPPVQQDAGFSSTSMGSPPFIASEMMRSMKPISFSASC